ncbi:MAG: hypothetical protein RBT34_14090 [Anaerolineaceae bacterium]|jgi:hypothetical protein|nr:hypothetical protein [Anaerolineaceae bacterium]
MAATQRKQGSLVFSIHLTLLPHRDADLIELLQNAPKGCLSGVVREAMRNGVTQTTIQSGANEPEPEIDMDDLGMEL